MDKTRGKRYQTTTAPGQAVGRGAHLRHGTSKAARVAQPRTQRQDVIAVGDVVTQTDAIDLMTVEGLRGSAFGTVVDCCWFDSDDSLRFRTFPAAQLDLFPRPGPTASISIGTEVRLRSRGPVMTVRALRRKAGVALADCAWSGPMGVERRRLFPRSGLVLTMLERFEDSGGREI